MPSHERLREGLARFKCGSRAGGSENRQAVRGKYVGNALTQWHFRSYDRQIDAFTPGERSERLRVCTARWKDPGAGCDTRVPRGAEYLRDAGLGRQLPGNRVLPRTAADDEYLHGEGWRLVHR